MQYWNQTCNSVPCPRLQILGHDRLPRALKFHPCIDLAIFLQQASEVSEPKYITGNERIGVWREHVGETEST